MKRLASFLMILVLTISFTWSGATIPDTKENSKTEKLKEVSATMVKMDLKFSNQNEFLFVNQNYSDVDIVVKTEVAGSNLPLKAVQRFSKTVKAKNQTINYRSPRDGFRRNWRNS